MKKNQKRISTGLWVFLAIALVVVASIGLTIYNNSLADQRQKESIQAEKDAKEAETSGDWVDDTNRSLCLSVAQRTYKEGWDADVKYLGRTDGRLPEPYASTHEQRLKDAKDECYRLYGYN